MPRKSIMLVLYLMVAFGGAVCHADGLPVSVPLMQQQTGSLIVSATVNGSAPADFLLDTGSGLLVVNRTLFKQIGGSDATQLRRLKPVSTRMADGRRRTVETYEAANFTVGNCELGNVRLAVVPGADRNILGLNALAKAGSFTVSLQPPTLQLANCRLATPDKDDALVSIR